MPVSFHTLQTVTLRNRKKLKAFIPSVFLNEKKEFNSLNIIFCSDEYLLEINKKHLKHDFFTDIITFDLSESKKAPIIGELYISIDRVKENSSTLKQSFIKELHRVVFHGILHLCGYKDKTSIDIITMRNKENEYLTKYGLKYWFHE